MISDEKTALAAIEVKITGVKKAFEQGPESLVEADLPLVVNFSASSTEKSLDLDAMIGYTERNYLARFYVAPINQGISGELELQVEKLLDEALSIFRKYPHLADEGGEALAIVGLQRSSLLGDSGVVVLNYAQMQYLGFEVRLVLRSLFRNQIAEYN